MPDEEIGYLGRTIEMPLVMGSGHTPEACVAETLEATTAVIATILEKGEVPPASSSEGRRDQQVNIRLTAEEKLLLEEASRREGFRSLSDYLRSVGLNRAG